MPTIFFCWNCASSMRRSVESSGGGLFVFDRLLHAYPFGEFTFAHAHTHIALGWLKGSKVWDEFDARATEPTTCSSSSRSGIAQIKQSKSWCGVRAVFERSYYITKWKIDLEKSYNGPHCAMCMRCGVRVFVRLYFCAVIWVHLRAVVMRINNK